MNKSQTCLSGKKLSKSEEIFEALGDLDELNACLGLARSFASKNLSQQILKQQDDLIEIGGFLAGMKKGDFLKEKTTVLEEKIKKLSQDKVKSFSRPGINQVSAALHLARAVCRRLERRLVRLKKKSLKPLIVFFNSFSLYLFWLAKKEEKI
ncbi:ATP:cob(I)alamin adenosyltransferase [Patescibacteria group bacterium]|nr:ATP:cob(I)alamin adenosyltransferase [Patescibacteria group bacterium]